MNERVLVLQLDGTALPNLACLRIAGHHRALGDEVVFRYSVGGAAAQRALWDGVGFDRVYASLIFEKTRPRALALKDAYPSVILGGTGWDIAVRLESAGVASEGPRDWSIYPVETRSIGFTQRGCRLSCKFCHVPKAEGKVKETATIADVWRGPPFPRDVVLLDNDFFGAPHWRDRVAELRDGRFRVSLTQGINARLIGDEEAAALASLDLWDDRFVSRRMYCAWDNVGDGARLFQGLDALKRAGIKPDRVMVYMLIGWRSTEADDLHRVARLREFGARPYPMPFTRTPELVGFQRWVVGSHDKRVSWDAFRAARFQPRNLARPSRETAGSLFA